MKKQISLKWKIGRYLFVFAFFIISLIFVFQFFLLEPMYENSKIQSIKQVATAIELGLQNRSSSEYIEAIQNQSDTCVLVYDSATGVKGGIGKQGCPLYTIDAETRTSFIEDAINSEDGTSITKQKYKSFYFTDGLSGFINNHATYETIYYTKIVQTLHGDMIIMVSGSITPLNATVQTLAHQLLYIALALLCSIAFLTYILYRQIAKPISMIAQEAKSLSKGKYTVNPKTNQYQEATELNQVLLDASVDIQKADKAKRDLISNVSHDLRTPLTMISGYGEMMMDLPEEKTDENLQVIVDESRRLNHLVNDLLDLSRLQDSRIVLYPSNFNLTECIRDQLKKYEVYCVQDGFEIDSHLDADIYVDADEKRIEQVFNNFMTNAVNYGGDKKKIIVREVRKGNSVRVEVQDFGEGIAQDDIKNVWDRYYKVDKEHKRVSNGSGIGLSIAKEILDLHQAQYGVNSTVGEGSTFYFELPLSENKGEENGTL